MAAAGGHHLLIVWPAGAGQTMLASRLPGLMRPSGVLSASDQVPGGELDDLALFGELGLGDIPRGSLTPLHA